MQCTTTAVVVEGCRRKARMGELENLAGFFLQFLPFHILYHISEVRATYEYRKRLLNDSAERARKCSSSSSRRYARKTRHRKSKPNRTKSHNHHYAHGREPASPGGGGSNNTRHLENVPPLRKRQAKSTPFSKKQSHHEKNTKCRTVGFSPSTYKS